MSSPDLSTDDAENGPEDAKGSALVSNWLQAIKAAEKREKKWRDSGCEVINLYEAEEKKAYQFNILYSNTETLAPALYSVTPTPLVQRRFKDDDPLGAAVSKVLQRSLAYLLDDGSAIYASFDTLMVAATLDSLVPGRGVTRFKYDAYIEETGEPSAPQTEDGSKQIEDGRVLPGIIESEVAKGEKVSWESVCGEQIPWDRFCHGYGRTWQEVPWIAYKWPMTREELDRNFGENGRKCKIAIMDDSQLDGGKKNDDIDKEMKVAWVYEIWDKDDKKVYFVSEGFKDDALKVVEDPLKLTGFFNCPQPLTLFQRVSGLTPQTLYAFYEEQAKELNRVTGRINRLIDALKVRGVYDSSIDALANIFAANDTALLPADNTSAMYDRGGLDKAIWMLPLDKIIQVLQQLYLNRQQTKAVIYEITGISDILRGASNPNETASAQNIKSQWGNLRLRKLQKRVQRYVVDSLRIMSEIVCGKFSQDTLSQMTSVKYPTNQQKQQAQAIMQQLGQMPPETLQQQPQLQQQIQMIQKMLALPSWEDIMKVMQNDIQRGYKIDIETNSTIEPEATEDKESMMGLMNALSQFLLGVQPLVESGSLPFDAMKAILLTICRRFNFGSQVEDELKQMQPPAPPQGSQPDPQLEAQKADLQNQTQALESQKNQFEVQTAKANMQMQMTEQMSSMQKQLDAKIADLDRTSSELQLNVMRERGLSELHYEKKIAVMQKQSAAEGGEGVQ
jgi:hypothetical protein